MLRLAGGCGDSPTLSPLRIYSRVALTTVGACTTLVSEPKTTATALPYLPKKSKSPGPVPPPWAQFAQAPGSHSLAA
jgi:hypothetical protein